MARFRTRASSRLSLVSGESSGGTAPQTSHKQARKNMVLKCMEFLSDGSCSSKFVTRQQILDVARAHGAASTAKTATPKPALPSPPPRAPPLPPRIPRGAARTGGSGQRRGPRGRVTETATVQPRKKRGGNALTMRDLRQVDPHFTAKPALWVRQHAVVVSLEGVRAIVFFDRMLLFNPDNAQVHDFVRYARRFLGGAKVEQVFLPFEFRALDAILENACYRLARDFGVYKPRIQTTLSELPREINAEQLERLRTDEQALNVFYARARKVQHAIQAVLDEDEDMADMYLTELHRRPQRMRNPLAHDEAETLLETHLQTVDDLTTKAELLNRTIDDTEDLLEIHLDTMQNRLLLVDLMITAISSILSFGTLIANLFGMNLMLPRAMRFMPSSQYYFYGLVTLLFTSMTIALLVLLRWCKLQGITHSRTKGHRLNGSPNRDSDGSPEWQRGILRRMRSLGIGTDASRRKKKRSRSRDSR